MVIHARDEDDALRIANDPLFARDGSVCSRDVDRALAVAHRLDTGNVSINSPLPSGDPAQPFGRVENSWYGREMGIEGIRDFVNLKQIYVSCGGQAAWM